MDAQMASHAYARYFSTTKLNETCHLSDPRCLSMCMATSCGMSGMLLNAIPCWSRAMYITARLYAQTTATAAACCRVAVFDGATCDVVSTFLGFMAAGSPTSLTSVCTMENPRIAKASKNRHAYPCRYATNATPKTAAVQACPIPCAGNTIRIVRDSMTYAPMARDAVGIARLKSRHWSSESSRRIGVSVLSEEEKARNLTK